MRLTHPRVPSWPGGHLKTQHHEPPFPAALDGRGTTRLQPPPGFAGGTFRSPQHLPGPDPLTPSKCHPRSGRGHLPPPPSPTGSWRRTVATVPFHAENRRLRVPLGLRGGTCPAEPPRPRQDWGTSRGGWRAALPPRPRRGSPASPPPQAAGGSWGPAAARGAEAGYEARRPAAAGSPVFLPARMSPRPYGDAGGSATASSRTSAGSSTTAASTFPSRQVSAQEPDTGVLPPHQPRTRSRRQAACLPAWPPRPARRAYR